MENQSELVRTKFAYLGTSMSLFGLILKNTLFTILTLGIYSPFAKTAIRKYLCSHTMFDGQRFHYFGTGMELLKGYIFVFLSAFLGYAGFGISFYLGGQRGLLIYVIGFVGALVLYILPLLITRSAAYRLSRTEYRGIRFSLDRENTEKLLKQEFRLALFLIPLSLGLYSIIFAIKVRSTIINNTYYGNKKFNFRFDELSYFKLAFFGGVLSYLTLGLAFPRLLYRIAKFKIDGIMFDNIPLHLNATVWQFYSLVIVNILLTIFSLGLALPYVFTRTMRFLLDNLYYQGEIDYLQIRSSGQSEKVDASGDSFSDFFDINLGI